jgi:hypothetical protein
VIAAYARLSRDFVFTVVDAEKDIYAQHEFIRNIFEASQKLRAVALSEGVETTTRSAMSTAQAVQPR